MAHSPGPWLDAEGSYGNYVAVKDASGRTVARVLWGDHDADSARLIAAAPELLEVAREAFGPIAALAEQNPHAVPLLEQLRKVIAKAEGR